MTKRREAGEQVDSSDIEKHKKDVFRMAALLDSGHRITLSDKLQTDLSAFVHTVSTQLPGKELFRAMGFPALNADALIARIKEVIGLA